MKVFAITITPEASMSRLHPTAYKTLAGAQAAIQALPDYDEPRALTDYHFRDNDYTDFLIWNLEVEE